MRLVIEQDNETIAVLDNWDGPVPREGDYIFHPPLNGGQLSLPRAASCPAGAS